MNRGKPGHSILGQVRLRRLARLATTALILIATLPLTTSATATTDQEAPEIYFLPQNPEQPELIRARVSDRISGPAYGRIEYRRLGSDAAFTALTTTLRGGVLEARFPSDQLPDGAYEFRAFAADWSGNTAMGTLNEAGEPMVLQNPVKDAALIQTTWAKRSSNGLLVKPGRRALLTGVLRDSDGRALTGQAIEVEELFEFGARPLRRLTTVRTNRAGRFRLRLRPGPSRRVIAHFRGNTKQARVSATALRLVAAGRVSLSLTPSLARNGRPVTLRGKVAHPGARIPTGGKLVAIQFLDPTRRRWRPVEMLRTNRRGRFTYRYRFRTISYAQRIIFRAVAVGEAGWPFRAAHTPGRSVLVYPG